MYKIVLELFYKRTVEAFLTVGQHMLRDLLARSNCEMQLH